jgi:hypothetical protein
MSNDRIETGCNAVVAATSDKQAVEPKAKGAATPTVRPWTSKFLLPSIRFRAPKRA